MSKLGWLTLFPWEQLLDNLQTISIRELRQNLKYVQHGRGRVKITNRKVIQAVLVTPMDAALLRVIDQHPEMIRQLEKLHPELLDLPTRSV